MIHPADNVATVVSEGVTSGAPIWLEGARPPETVTARAPIPYGHKVARGAIALGGNVVKYGLPIGRATRAIRRGDHVHVHNVASRRAGPRRPRGQGPPA